VATSVPGLDNGGSILVGGTGGVDNNLLSINGQPTARVSKGETVTVSPNKKSKGGDTVFYLDLKGAQSGVEETVRGILSELLPEAQAKSSEEMERNIVELFSRERL
jgi:hypothetical protein